MGLGDGGVQLLTSFVSPILIERSSGVHKMALHSDSSSLRSCTEEEWRAWAPYSTDWWSPQQSGSFHLFCG